MTLALMLVVMPASLRAAPLRAPAIRQQRAVLFLAVEDFTRPYVRLLFESVSDRLLSAPDAPAIYFESLDASRFQDRQYLGDLRDWLRRKYRDTRIDMVVPLGEDALAFLTDNDGEPWSSADVLYVEVGSVKVDGHATLGRAGGMLLEDHFPAALEAIKTVLPDTERIALLYGASAIELTRWGGFAEKVRTAGLEPIEFIGRALPDTLDDVKRLTGSTVLMILAPSLDANGHVVPANQACAQIAAAAAVPTFTLGAQDFGCGVVGGLMRDWTIVGRQLGDEVLARFEHPSSDVLTIPVSDYTTLAFDYRQLQRWNIAERRLPAGSVVAFRQPSMWRDHRTLVVTTLAVTMLQSALIAGLAIERRRRRRAEIDARRNLVAIAHMDRRAAMGELTASLAHELNQPLNAILQNAGVAQMLLTSTPVPPALTEMADIVSDISKDDLRASEVIRRIRGLLQKHEVEAVPLGINDVVQEALAILSSDAQSRGIDLETNLAEPLPPVLGDRVHLQQVLLNLMMNAMDAVAGMPPERCRVSVSTAQDDVAIRVAVVDRGTGIAAGGIPEIFKPFYTTKEEGRGMGMGLAIARNIIEAHSGHIMAENNPDGGATVWFTLPPARPSPAPASSSQDLTKVL